MELFVYDRMVQAGSQRTKPDIILLDEGEDELLDDISKWESFDATACKCAFERDKTRLFQIISACPGGVQSFNDHMREMASPPH